MGVMTYDKESFRQSTRDILDQYLSFYPNELPRQAEFKKHLDNTALDLRLRSTIPEGHVCSSGILLLPGNKILMLHHKALDIWVVPGGHYDIEDGQISNAAIRETVEETGLGVPIKLHPWHEKTGIPLDIDTHPIPRSEKKSEDAHQHFDFRYVLVVDEPEKILEQLALDENEVLDFSAIPIEEVDENSSIYPAIAKLNLLTD